LEGYPLRLRNSVSKGSQLMISFPKGGKCWLTTRAFSVPGVIFPGMRWRADFARGPLCYPISVLFSRLLLLSWACTGTAVLFIGGGYWTRFEFRQWRADRFCPVLLQAFAEFGQMVC
jgi:hypothetical protein